jgi:hypothetical protein
LLQAFQALRTIAFEDGFEDQPSQRFVQRIVAVRDLPLDSNSPVSQPARLRLC